MGILLALIAVLLFPLTSPAEVNWDTVSAKKVPLFYPGMTSWEFLTGSEHASGANAVSGLEKSCQDCHVKGDRVDIFADDIMKGKLRRKSREIPFEPEPPQGITPFITLELQAAYDATDFYLRLKWPSPKGVSFKNPADVSRGFYDRVAVQLNGNLRSFSRAGCFMSCHDDVSYMPDAPSEEEVMANPFYAKQRRKDVRLYAYVTRNRGWSDLKSEKEMDKYLKAGAIIDLWIAGFRGPEVISSDESIFYDRIRDSTKDIKVEGTWQEGFYTVTIKRKLTTLDPMDIQMQEGKTFTAGIAVYDQKNGYRKHHVSFPLSIAIGGGKADLTALKIIEGKQQVK
ncbi:MAG: ethylbenzene dehydrogenase-related protein [Deltaproteobacteria bacterium]|nr:ethylbenzene dehydrogenase-related protein [Deltaproteobacteria bacterium]